MDFLGISDTIVGGIGKLAETARSFITTDSDRAEFDLEVLKTKHEMELKLQGQLTTRHANDMQSDSWLSKNIRPMLLIFAFAVVTIFGFTDGNISYMSGDVQKMFTIKESYVALWENILLVAIPFYYGSRAIEKYGKIKKK